MRVITVLCAILLAGCSGEADFSGAIETEILPAESYQQEIVAIDRLLFEEKPLGDDGIRALQTILDGLAKRIGEQKPASKFLTIESLELRHLAIRAGRLSPDGTGLSLQNDWMRIRNNLFDDRAWFARSAADLQPAAATVAPPPPPPHARVYKPSSVAPEQIERRSRLSGRWKAISVAANGKPRDDEEILGSVWDFELPHLLVRDGTGHETSYNCAIEDGYLVLTPAGGEEGWAKYELNAQGLRIAFFDGLQGKPESFEPRPGGEDPLLVVVQFVPVR